MSSDLPTTTTESDSELEISRCSNFSGTPIFLPKPAKSNYKKVIIRRISSRRGFFADMPAPVHRITKMKIGQKAPLNSIALPVLRLENVGSYHLEIDIGDHRYSTVITLKWVPSFLIEAFIRLDHLDAWAVEGIFRKEGNVNRLKNLMPVYFGTEPIPEDCTEHDICTLIKRFFRELRIPIFADKQRTILKYAETINLEKSMVDAIIGKINFELHNAHVSTLGYLMRLLKEVSERSNKHQMTVDNLARIFAPSLFRDENPPAYMMKEPNEIAISIARSMNSLQCSVIRLLILNSHLIGMPKNFYKATRKSTDLQRNESTLLNSTLAKKEFCLLKKVHSPRSSSAVPILRFIQGSSNSGYFEEDSRYSSRSKNSKKNRRRSSSMICIIDGVRNLLIGPSPGEERRSRQLETHSKSRLGRTPSLSLNVKFRTRQPSKEQATQTAPITLDFGDDKNVAPSLPDIVQHSPGFSRSRMNVDAIRKATKPEELPESSSIEAKRPSIVALQRNHRGLVRERVTLFDSSIGFSSSARSSKTINPKPHSGFSLSCGGYISSRKAPSPPPVTLDFMQDEDFKEAKSKKISAKSIHF